MITCNCFLKLKLQGWMSRRWPVAINNCKNGIYNNNRQFVLLFKWYLNENAGTVIYCPFPTAT